MNKFTFDNYLKEKNIFITEEEKLYCLNCINEKAIFLTSRAIRKSWLNALVLDYKFWVKDGQINELEKALELLKDKNNYYKFVNENTGIINVDLAIQEAKG